MRDLEDYAFKQQYWRQGTLPTNEVGMECGNDYLGECIGNLTTCYKSREERWGLLSRVFVFDQGGIYLPVQTPFKKQPRIIVASNAQEELKRLAELIGLKYHGSDTDYFWRR